MLAAIKLFFAGFKTYFYGAIVVIVCACAIWYTIHERHIGAAKIEARDVVIKTQRTALATAATALRQAAEALAQKKSDEIGDKFEKDIAAPVVAPPHVLCNRPAATRSQVPGAADDKSVDSGAPVLRTEVTVDIGPAVTTVGKDADAQINALLDQIQVLVDEMNGTKK